MNARNENKTRQTSQSVGAFVASIENPNRRADAARLVEIMAEITGEEAHMWGPSIIGFGSYHYKYKSGREGDGAIVGFSPRKANLVLYIMPGFSDYDRLMQKLGRYKTGKSCLYVNRLTDIDEDVLKALIADSVAYMRQNYPMS